MAGRFMQIAANRDYTKWWQSEGSWPAQFQKAKAPITGRPYSVRENYIRRPRRQDMDAYLI
jgi:hypothetical protein